MENSNHKDKTKGINPFSLFRYANFSERLLIFFGSIFSVLEGAGMPLMSIVFGNMSNTLVVTLNGFAEDILLNKNTIPVDLMANNTSSISTNMTSTTTILSSVVPEPRKIPVTRVEFESNIAYFSLLYVGLGVLIYISSFIQIFFLTLAQERQVIRIRRKFFANILRQELSWFDANQSGALSSKLNDDIERVRDGLGDQLGLCIKQVSAFFSGFIVGFITSWRLTLVIMAATPLLALFAAHVGKIVGTSAKREQEKYAQAGALAEEVLVAIRTVFCLNGQKSELKAYNQVLKEGKKLAINKYMKMCFSISASFIVIYSTYGLTLYVAAYLITDNLLTVGSALTVLMSVMMGATSLGNIVPPMQTILMACSSATLIYEVIESEPHIDASDDDGMKLSKVSANIKFKDVTFSYPSRPTLPVLTQLNLDLCQGKTVAVCGKTGCGKSTIINLLLRFYDPNYGSIYLDNCNYVDLNVAWVRSLIGLVEQEPSLFDCSILENIALGSTNESKQTYEKIIAVAKVANAHDFIMSLPDKYNTRCGDRGYQMSGGQKQRIAIARALLSDPRILLLDEATSALDSESESMVQAALNKARQGRTTVVIAHRLSTIRDADLICVLDGGRLLEIGQHNELMAARGDYYNLVTNQVFDDLAPNNNKMGYIDSDDNDGYISNKSGKVTPKSRHSDKESSKKYLPISYDSLPGFFRKQNKQVRHPRALTFRDITAMLKPEVVWFSFGILACCFGGVLMPVFGLFYAQIFETLSLSGDILMHEAIFWAIMFVAYGLAFAFGMFTRIYFTACGIEECTARLRAECFKSILRQHVGWFDEVENSPQRLTSRLSSDVPQIKAIINSRFAAFVSGFTTIIVALVIAFVINWRMALLLAAAVPILMYVGSLQMKHERKDKSDYLLNMEHSSRLATEAIEHVKLIQAIGQESYFVDKYMGLLRKAMRGNIAASRKYSFLYALSQSTIYFIYAASFRFGGYLIASELITPIDMFRVFFCIAFTAVSVGQWGGISGDLTRAYEACYNVRRIQKLQPTIDSLGAGGIKPVLKGHITFQNVCFRYPTRPDSVVLQNLNLTIKAGTSLALVGASGNGKSTIASLLLRFYDPDQGVIKIDNFDLRCINLGHLRRNVCIVSQEPVLFKLSIKQNILYGLDANHYTMTDVMNAAKLANIHDFIQSLPDGYDTQVGERGTQLSGGQKQRVAIARAVIREPSILILDEATSALDSESEALVSQALEKASIGKTCIKIAHRLSTVRDCDQIAVIDRGAFVEKGNHDELMSLGERGYYYRLMQKQEIRS